MFATLKPKAIVLDDLRRLVEWTRAWYEEAVAANFVHHPYQPDAELATRLQQYFHAGLTPAEAVELCFGIKH
ncbi:MAG TPA: hypothetical protein VL598_11195 [Trinickia sp.]|uniref:hypothetical protein n=1 Tax=Trinickia sp. TaxID=2571163 RepID=UPI002BD56E00|nr:hypothetical protein [Trinickia sp.]HTI18219.1 hypothetical protein [Trinickia sp.]